MVNGRSSPPKSSVFPCEISDSVGRHDLSFDGSENTNLFVEELLHKTETEHPFLVSQPNTREIHLLTARRRLSLGATCDSADARRRATPRSILFPPVFPAPQNRTSESNAYNAVRALAPKDQAKEWWKMLYGDDKPQCHVRSMIPRSAPSKSCLSSTKRKDGHGNRTPNSVATSIPADTSGGANTPLRNFVRCVKFGSASAAEFEKDDPPQGSLTPMPPTKAAQRFPTDFKEPDPETAELIAMTKENSATLAEWDFFDDGEGELVSDATRSPLENLRSRRESGRFTPFCESDPFERIEDEAFVMDTTETVAMYDDEIVEMDVGKTLEANVTQAQNRVNTMKGEDLLVELSSTATQLFMSLAIRIEAERQNNVESHHASTDILEREVLECSDSICLAMIEECLDDTLRSVADPQVSILQKKRIQYQLKCNPDVNAMIVARANFQFQSVFTDSLELISLNDLQMQIKIQTERVTKGILCMEKASKRNLFRAIADEEESIKSLENVLLAAQIRKETLRRRNLEKQLFCRPRIPLTYYVTNFIVPFQLLDSSTNEITLEFSSSTEKCRLQLTADIKGENFAFKRAGSVDDGRIVNQESVAAAMSRAILSASCTELECDISFVSLPIIVFRVAQVLHRLDQFLEHFMSLAACCEDFSLTEDGSLLSVILHLPDMTKVELVYNFSGPLLLHPDSFRPKVSIHHNGNTSTELYPPLSRFLNVGFF